MFGEATVLSNKTPSCLRPVSKLDLQATAHTDGARIAISTGFVAEDLLLLGPEIEVGTVGNIQSNTLVGAQMHPFGAGKDVGTRAKRETPGLISGPCFDPTGFEVIDLLKEVLATEIGRKAA